MYSTQGNFGWKKLIIGGSILLVIIILVEAALFQKVITVKPNKVNQDSSDSTRDWKVYTSTQYGQVVSFKYPEKYTVTKGGRPFNINGEGPSIAIDLHCQSMSGCDKHNNDVLSINIYENRKKLMLEEWMENSANKPQAECTKKDPRVSINKIEYLNKSAYQFSYISDPTLNRGCADIPLGEIRFASELFYENNQSIFNIRKYTVNNDDNAEFETIIATLKVE